MTRSTVKNILFVLVGLILLVAYLYTCNEIEVYRHSLEAEARANGAQFAIIMQGAALGYLFNISAQDGVMLYLLFMSAMVIPCGILVFGVMNLKEEYDNMNEAAKRQAKQIRKAEPTADNYTANKPTAHNVKRYELWADCQLLQDYTRKGTPSTHGRRYAASITALTLPTF